MKNRTLANLSHWPEPKVDALARTLKGLPPKLDLSQAFEITRSLPHGHVAAVLGTARRLGVEELIDATPSRTRDLVTAMVVAQVIDPGSKLAVARGPRAEPPPAPWDSCLAWPAVMRTTCTRPWTGCLSAKRSSKPPWLPGIWSTARWCSTTCPWRRSRAAPAHGRIGHPRDGVKGRLQIVYGLLCSPAGIPIAIEVFEGNTADPNTLAAQITKINTRFGLSRVCLVGDRGMLTHARIRDEVRPAQLDWISALRAPQIKALVEEGALQLSLFDTQDLFEISSPEFPGERLVCCHNPALAEKRARKRQDLLAATEKELTPIAAATGRAKRALRGQRHDRATGGQGDQPLQDGQTLHPHRSPTNPSPSPATPRPSPPRPPWTASTCCAPACPNTPWAATMSCCATRSSKTSSGSFALSTPNWTCGPSDIGWPTGCAPTCSCACCPTTSAGT